MERNTYFQYLKNSARNIPYSTRRRRERQNDVNAQNNDQNGFNNQPNQHIDNDEPIQPEEIAEFHVEVAHLQNNHENDREETNELENESDEQNSDSDEENEHQVRIGEEQNEEEVAVLQPCADVFNGYIPADAPADVPEERVPLYEGCRLTKEESDLLIMSYIIRHGITDVGLQDLLELINSHLPRSYLSSSKHKFLKNFPSMVDCKIRYFCPICNEPLVFGERQTVSTCQICNERYSQNDLKQSSHYFMYLPLKEQLKKLISGPLFHQLQRDRSVDGVLSDVSSGKFYKDLQTKGVISNYDISIQWNTDGVNTFTSSKRSMWPIQVSVNELPYQIRKDNILLVGLWCSVEKPSMNIYLEQFVDELQDLHQNGIECLPPGFANPVTIKVHTLLAPVDSVCRCSCQNIHQFNGVSGCPYCLNQGERIETGRGFSRIYSGGMGILRTTKQHIRDCKLSQVQNVIINGVKGPSILMLLSIFSIIHSFPPEYMHALLLGVVKLFLSTWIDPANSQETFYINLENRAKLDKMLLNIMPPREITRTPQSINNLCLWKASEFKHFLLYYSLPCLKDILPVNYYKHWSLLVFASHKFLAETIDQRDFNAAKTAMNKFVSDTEVLYGKKLMKFNVHLLIHMADYVQNFGALWAWSAFSYESYNRILRNMLHGSQYVSQQVCKSYLRLLNIRTNALFFKENCSDVGKTLFIKLMGKNVNIFINNNGNRGLKVCGLGKVYVVSLLEKLSIQALLNCNIEDQVVSYDRFVYDNILYHSNTYSRLVKRNNSIIKTVNDNFMTITSIVAVSVENTGDIKYVIIGNAFEVSNIALRNYNNIPSSSSYCHVARRTNNISTCLLDHILSKCIIISIPNPETYYIFPLVNKIETD